MKIFAGFDGGATKTKCVFAAEDLKILAESEGGPSNFLIIGAETVARTILNLIRECSKQAGISPSEIEAAVVGSTGAGRKSDALKLEEAISKAFKSEKIDINKLDVVSDATIALEGAFGGKPGSILIAGTGSIMYGKDSRGNFYRVGGFGKFIGDEGGGNSLGRKGLTAVAKEFDGRGEKTLLTDLVNKKFGIKDGTSLIRKVYSENLSLSEISPLVTTAAAEGDEICRRIIDEESDELILHIKAMQKKIDVSPLQLVLIGSPITKPGFYSELLRKKIEKLGKVKLQHPEYPPEMGAVILAKKTDKDLG